MGSSLGIKLSCLSPDTNLVFINQMAWPVIEDSRGSNGVHEIIVGVPAAAK